MSGDSVMYVQVVRLFTLGVGTMSCDRCWLSGDLYLLFVRLCSVVVRFCYVVCYRFGRLSTGLRHGRSFVPGLQYVVQGTSRQAYVTCRTTVRLRASRCRRRTSAVGVSRCQGGRLLGFTVRASTCARTSVAGVVVGCRCCFVGYVATAFQASPGVRRHVPYCCFCCCFCYGCRCTR